MKRLAVLLAATLLAACSSTWESGEPVQPATYVAGEDAVPRYAGKLRRLAVLGAVVEPVGEKCVRRYPAAMAGWIDEEARAYLADWKGYAVLAAREDALVRALGPWQARTPEARQPPGPLGGQLRALAAAQGVDGVLVLHATPQCIDMTDAMLNVFVVGMPSFYRKMFARDFSAGIYDAGGALVWQRYGHLGPLDQTESSGSRANAAASVESLLGLLENAIPEILLR